MTRGRRRTRGGQRRRAAAPISSPSTPVASRKRWYAVSLSAAAIIGAAIGLSVFRREQRPTVLPGPREALVHLRGLDVLAGGRRRVPPDLEAPARLLGGLPGLDVERIRASRRRWLTGHDE